MKLQLSYEAVRRNTASDASTALTMCNA